MGEWTRRSASTFLRVLDGHVEAVPPVWLMRQAGRYLPEYRKLRATVGTFLDLCYTPDLATEVTLQPIRRFGFDAAILFSDILVVPDAFGQSVSFEAGAGPQLVPINTPAAIAALPREIDLGRLMPVFETVKSVRAALPADTALIGFCGAPWTVAGYMIAGHGTPDQAPARVFAYREPDAFQALIDRLVAGSIAYLARQVEAGADCVQIFDTWAGVLPAQEFERWCLHPVKAIIAGLHARHPNVKVIAFPRGIGAKLPAFADATGAAAVGLDTTVDPAWAAGAMPARLPVQGNLDPLALLAGGAGLDAAIDRIRTGLQGRPHIFNLGHGVLPETPVAHVERLLERLRTSR